MTFVISGAVACGSFAWLVSLPTTSDFWFINGTHYQIPKLSYWIGFGVFLSAGMLVAYGFSVRRGWLAGPERSAITRRMLAMFIFLVAFPLGYAISSSLTEFFDPILGYAIAYFVIVVLISFAFLLITSMWKLKLSIFLLLAVPLSYFFTIVAYNILELSNHGYDILRVASFGSLLSAAFGYWFAISAERRRSPIIRSE